MDKNTYTHVCVRVSIARLERNRRGYFIRLIMAMWFCLASKQILLTLYTFVYIEIFATTITKFSIVLWVVNDVVAYAYHLESRRGTQITQIGCQKQIWKIEIMHYIIGSVTNQIDKYMPNGYLWALGSFHVHCMSFCCFYHKTQLCLCHWLFVYTCSTQFDTLHCSGISIIHNYLSLWLSLLRWKEISILSYVRLCSKIESSRFSNDDNGDQTSARNHQISYRLFWPFFDAKSKKYHFFSMEALKKIIRKF